MMSCQPSWTKNTTPSGVWIPGETATVCVHVSNDTLSDVIDAVEAWDTAIGKWKHLVPIVGPSDQCNYVIREAEVTEEVGYNTLASTKLHGRDIFLYKNRYELDPVGVVLHEIGHVLGARHMEGTLMAPQITYGKYRCPDAATIAQVAMVNAIDPSLFSWCSQP